MKLQLLISACLCTVFSFANPGIDSVPITRYVKPHEVPQSYKPAYRILEKDLVNLPFTNLMEVINSMFPFVFNDPPGTADYNFLVDGKLLFNPNAINFSQIAAIEFYPVYFNIGNGTLAGKGTFVIHTKTGTGYQGLGIRSQTGLNMPTDKTQRILNTSGLIKPNKRELFTYQDVSYAYSNSNVKLSSALSYTRNAYPGFEGFANNGQNIYDHGFNRIRFSNFINYRATNKLILNGSLALYRHQNEYQSSAVFTSDHNYIMSVDARTMYGVAAVGADYHINRSTVNTFQVEYSGIDRDYEAVNQYYRPAPGDDTYTDNLWNIKGNQFAVTNSFRGNFERGSNIKFNYELLLRYWNQKFYDKRTYEAGQILGPSQTLDGTFLRRQRSIAVMPRVGVTLNGQFFATAGLTYDSWNSNINILGNIDDKDADVFPYAGLRWSMPAAAGALSSLHVHTTYGKSSALGSQSDLLDNNPDANGNYTFTNFRIEPSPTAGYSWISGVDAGFINNKLLVSLNYLTGKYFPFLYTGGFPGLRFEEVKRSGVSASVAVQVADKEKFRCNLRAILFYERNVLQNDYLLTWPGTDIRYNNRFLNDDISPEWHGTFHANISTGGIFLQAIALLRPSDGWYQSSNRKSINNTGLTFLSAGYRFPFVKPLKHLEVSIQARNLLLMKEPVSDYYTDSYVGVGLKLNL